MKRENKMFFAIITVLAAAAVFTGCMFRQNAQADPLSTSESPANNGTANGNAGNKTPGGGSGSGGSGKAGAGSGSYAVRTTLKELTSVDPDKGIGVYGRYTELTASGDVPEALSRALAEVNARAKETVETRAARFLAENKYPAAAQSASGSSDDGSDSGSADGRYRCRNISYIVNVTRADEFLFSILETEWESGIGSAEGEQLDPVKNCFFHSAVYDTKSGNALSLSDFLKDPGSLPVRLNDALKNKYASDGLYAAGTNGAGANGSSGANGTGGNGAGAKETPAWTADYLGLRFYLDGAMVPEEKRDELGLYSGEAVHVSIPYTALDGPLSETAAAAPESFIAQIEKNTEYALPHDKRTIRVEKAADSSGSEAYRIVIREDKDEKAWWLEHAGDASAFYVFRSQGGYYFYRLEEREDLGYVYSFASPDGGFDRFANQNAQCFDSFLNELSLAVPSNPDCVHMRERARKFMDPVPGFKTSFTPNGHYAFLPEAGRGRKWLHFSLIDDTLSLDSGNVGCRLLHELTAAELDENGNEGGKVVIPAGEVLHFLRVSGESELYYYMSPQYSMYQSGVRDYLYDCVLSDGRPVRLVTRYESSLFVDDMYLDRIGEPVMLGAVQKDKTGHDEVPEHFVEIGGKKYKLIRDLSLRSEVGEEIDFGSDIWWKVERYTGTFTAENEDAELILSPDGNAVFTYEGRAFTGKLPEKRYYRDNVYIYMESGYEHRTFQIIVEDKLPPHDPSFKKIRFYSEGLPATNEPSKVPPIEVELVRQ